MVEKARALAKHHVLETKKKKKKKCLVMVLLGFGMDICIIGSPWGDPSGIWYGEKNGIWWGMFEHQEVFKKWNLVGRLNTRRCSKMEFGG